MLIKQSKEERKRETDYKYLAHDYEVVNAVFYFETEGWKAAA